MALMKWQHLGGCIVAGHRESEKNPAQALPPPASAFSSVS